MKQQGPSKKEGQEAISMYSKFGEGFKKITFGMRKKEEGSKKAKQTPDTTKGDAAAGKKAKNSIVPGLIKPKMKKQASKKEGLEQQSFKRTSQEIAAQLDEAVNASKQVNRSSELVPLNRDYDAMRKEVKALSAVAVDYHSSIIQLDKSRLKMAKKFSSLLKNTSIIEGVTSKVCMLSGEENPIDSFVDIVEKASLETTAFAASYKENIIDYALAWEQVTSTRIESERKEVANLVASLSHYQSKVDGVETKVNMMNGKEKEAPEAMVKKLDRNAQKLNEAWIEHERKASKLCNLLEEVTLNGWKYVIPLVTTEMELEVQRATAEYNILVDRLPSIKEDFDKDSERRSQNLEAITTAATKQATEPSGVDLTESKENLNKEAATDAVTKQGADARESKGASSLLRSFTGPSFSFADGATTADESDDGVEETNPLSIVVAATEDVEAKRTEKSIACGDETVGSTWLPQCFASTS